VSVLERIRDIRNRLIASRKFRDRVQKNKVFQRVASKSAEQLFAVCSGFIHSQVLYAVVEMSLPEQLQDGPKSLAQLAAATGLPADRLSRFLQAACALDLVEHRGEDRFALGPAGAALIDNEGLRNLVRHHRYLYEDLTDPIRLIEGASDASRLQDYWAYARSDRPAAIMPAAVADYSETMGMSQQLIATLLIDDPVFSDCRRVLDIGGGDGTFAIALAGRWPGLSVTVVDLPAVVDLARDHVQRAGLRDRIDVVGLDFLRDAFPGGYDGATLIRVLHDHEDDDVLTLLRSARAALRAGGSLVIAEPMADSTVPGRLIDAYFSIYLLAMGQGRPRSKATLRRFLEDAGYDRIRSRAGPPRIISQVLVAQSSDKL
jgi:demethylspheroidene O-methyltransferase